MALAAPAARREQLPHAGPEVGPGEHRVEDHAGEDEDEREGVEHQAGRPSVEEGGASLPSLSSGMRARRRRIHTTPPATAR